MIILHSIHSEASRAFVAEFGAGQTVIDWYGDKNSYIQYLLSGLPQPGGFPFVVDQVARKGFVNPESIQWVIDELLEKHDDLETSRTKKITRLEVMADEYIERKGYRSGFRFKALNKKEKANHAQKEMIDYISDWINTVINDPVEGMFKRIADATAATTIEELEAVSEGFAYFDATDPEITLYQIETAT